MTHCKDLHHALCNQKRSATMLGFVEQVAHLDAKRRRDEDEVSSGTGLSHDWVPHVCLKVQASTKPRIVTFLIS